MADENVHDADEAQPPTGPVGLDGAIRAALGNRFDHDAPSVLQRIHDRGAPSPRIHLTDPSGESSPVLRPTADDGGPGDRYRVVGEVARGGVGTVIQVRDMDLGRDVAVKVLHDRYAQNPEVVQRFVEEAQIGGQLQHPGVVPVYELGVQRDSRPFFAMKLIKGATLSSILARRSSPQKERAEMLQIFQKICQTMAYAHARKVIHRDLKPSNVMVGAFGEVQVVDWGFAKVLDRGGVADERMSRREQLDLSVIETVRSGSSGVGSASVAGAVLGTPAYMPPEQALGDIERLDERADVFALGAILCEILTGHPPYAGGTANPLVQAARAQLESVFEDLDRCGADPRVIEIAKTCLSPVRTKRPRDAGQVERAITQYLHSREEQARTAELKASAAEARADAEHRARKRVLAWAGTAVAALLIGVVGLVAAGRASAKRAEQTARLVDAELEQSGTLARAARAQEGAASDAWQAAIDGALAAVAIAEREDADPATRDRAQSTLATHRDESARAAHRAERWSADRALERELREYAVRARLPESYDLEHEGDDLVLALAEWGLRLRRDSPAQAAEALREISIRSQIVEAIDLYRLGLDETERQPLDAILATVDPDPWRTEIRAAGSDATALEGEADNWSASERGAGDAILLGDALAASGALQRATSVLRAALDRHPAHPQLATSLACAVSRGETPDWAAVGAALDVARQGGELPTGLRKLEVRTMLGIEAIERGLGLARALRAEHPEDESMAELLATALDDHAAALIVSDRHEAAVAARREASQVTPEDDARRVGLVSALLATHDYTEAQEVTRDHVARDPEDWKRQALLARVLEFRVNQEGKRGLSENLLAAARAAADTCPEDARPLQEVWLAQYLNLAGRPEEAEVAARALLGVEDRGVRLRACWGLGKSLSILGRYTEAIEYFEETAALAQPDEKDRYVRLAALNARTEHARVLWLLGRHADAVAHLDACVADLPDTGHNHRVTSAEYLKFNQAGKALEHVEKALELDPQDPVAHDLKIRALTMQGHLEEALHHIDAAARVGGESIGFYRLLCLARLHRIDDAIEALGRTNLTSAELQALARAAGQLQLDRLRHRILHLQLRRRPADWQVRLGLGGLLASSPDPQVADGELALEVVGEVPAASLRGYGWYSDLKRAEYQANLRLGRAEEALAELRDGIRWMSVLGYANNRADEGRLLALQGRFAEGRRLLEDSLAHVEAAGSDVHTHPMGAEYRANLRVALGPILTAHGLYGKAMQNLEEALTIVRPWASQKARVLSVAAQVHLARLALLQGDVPRARQYADAAVARAAEVNIPAEAPPALVTRARVHLAAGDVEPAHADATRAVAAIEAMGKARDRWDEADAKLVLGLVLLRQNRLEEAKKLLKQAEDMGRDLDYAPTIAEACCRMAALPGGDIDAATETLAQLEERLPLHMRIDLHHLLFEAGGGKTHADAARNALDELLADKEESEREALLSHHESYRAVSNER